MIDTDKYEGHTPAPWRFGKQGATHSEDGKTAIIRPYPQLESIGGEDKVTLIAIHHGDATPKDLKLMIDAPLLLAEVKRLHKNKFNLFTTIEQKLNEKGDEGEAIWEANPNGHYKEDELRGWCEALEFVLNLMKAQEREE
jgi:hypothetical protein